MPLWKALSKICLRNGDDVFLLVEYELNKKLFVQIINLEFQEIYAGHLNDVELRSQAARIRLTFDEFIQKAIKALAESAADNSNFLYCLDEQDDLYKFQWKSIDEEQTIISLGSVDVKKENFAITLKKMLEMISMEMVLMRNKIQELETEKNKTQSQTSDALKQLHLATEMKEKLEKEMYSKFALVLNEKKRKIRELQQKNKHNSHFANSELPKKKSKKNPASLISDTSDSVAEEVDEARPSTSNNKSFLFLDDDDGPILLTNQTRIRNRKALVSKKENENKLTSIKSNHSSKKITVDEDESDDNLFHDL